MKHHRHGFTLVELSIVLVIIGLVAAGILTGKDMIRSAELRSVISDTDKFKLAINVFRLKYNALPGDMINATEIWGSDDMCPDDSSSPDTPKIATCNGNGDGQIRNIVNDSEEYEVFRAVQQLANAGFIEGLYTGVTGPSFRYNTETGINIPKLRNFEAGILPVHNDTRRSGDHLYPSTFRLMIHIGKDAGISWNYNPYLSPEDAFWIDTKADDGRPGKGIWMAYKPGSYVDSTAPHCASSDDPDVAIYNNLVTQEIVCAQVHIIQRD